MARMPGAIWRPITVNKSRWRLVPLRVNLHVAVSEAASLHGYFNAPGRVDSHFYVRRDGTIEQYVDTSVVAYADLEGNGSSISVETQGGVKNANGEPWTAAQVEALARIYAWAVRTHGIARQVAKDSRPGSSSHGLSWHRLGCDGNFPGPPLHGRVAGGRRYSRQVGKVCPGNAKIRQVPAIYARAMALLGSTTPVSNVKPVSPSKPSLPKGYLDMHPDELNKHLARHAENVHAAIKRDLPQLVADAVWTFVTRSEPRSGWTMLRRAVDAAQATNAALPQIAGKVGASIDTDELAAGLAEPLTEALAGSVSGEVVEAALRRVFADAANPTKED